MTAENAALTRPAATRPALFQVLRVVAPLVLLLILVQAFFAGRGLFLDHDMIDVHGGLGTLTALLVIVQAALVLFAGLRGGTRTPLLITSLLLVVLVIGNWPSVTAATRVVRPPPGTCPTAC